MTADLEELARKLGALANAAVDEAGQAQFWDFIGTIGPAGILSLCAQLRQARVDALEECAVALEAAADRSNVHTIHNALITAAIQIRSRQPAPSEE